MIDNKELVFIQAVPNNRYYIWQLSVQLDNFRKYGYSQLTHNLIFIPHDRLKEGITQEWRDLEAKYQEAKFYYFFDEDNFLKTDINKINYIPLLRPYCLREYFRQYPELKDKVIFYYDADILFTKEFDFSPYLNDDICYLSNTDHYLNLQYWDGKIEDCKEELKDKLKDSKPIDYILQKIGIDRQIAERNNSGVGGAQYILKNIDYTFWQDILDSCKIIKPYFSSLNKIFFESEDKGWQSWTADMIAVLWNLWKRGQITKTPKELDFCWATDPIEKIKEVSIFHNAGVNSSTMVLNGLRERIFYKGMYINDKITPFDDDQQVYLENISEKYASRFYSDAILNTKNNI